MSLELSSSVHNQFSSAKVLTAARTLPNPPLAHSALISTFRNSHGYTQISSRSPHPSHNPTDLFIDESSLYIPPLPPLFTPTLSQMPILGFSRRGPSNEPRALFAGSVYAAWLMEEVLAWGGEFAGSAVVVGAAAAAPGHCGVDDSVVVRIIDKMSDSG